MASKVYLSQLSQEIIDFIQNYSGAGGEGGLRETIISNAACGAAGAGTIFPAYTSFTDFAKKLLLKDIAPSVSTTFSGAGVHEKGTSVNGCTITLKITNLPSVTLPINEIRFYDGNNLISTLPFQEGQNTYTFIYNDTISDDKTLTAEVVYSENQKVSSKGNFTFVYASYYGVTKLSSISSADATALTADFKKSIKTSKALNWGGITLNDERFCYMYPASLGNLTSIKDGNGFEQLSGYTKTQVTITTPIDNKLIKYNCYLLTDAATGSGFSQIYS